MYKLLALDMDGTLLNSEKTISPRTFDALQAAKAQGVHVVLASGRPINGLQRYLQELGLTSDEHFVVSYNGSLVQRVGNGEVIHQTMMSGRDTKDIFAESQRLGVYIHAFCAERGLLTHEDNPYSRLEAEINGVELKVTDFNQLGDDDQFIKVMMVAEENILNQAEIAATESMQQRFTIARSYPVFLEFLHPEANKGIGVAKLAELLDIEQAEVMCVGDADNDRHMLEYAGLAVVMDNAEERVKALADVITASNNDDGVALAVEQHILAAEALTA
ncbi:Cof-type HAD-IIB family hydrolase [Aliagarivorans marinus]|uniref:Cof-type HAD-IIB family hydrolase n=1 Tax=Aliagarivorans marinus TaxID=561965 RepID=UPI000425D816|nr:Cof-type HAD-IIB family hydrolase [Aliagarivorans marinus]